MPFLLCSLPCILVKLLEAFGCTSSSHCCSLVDVVFCRRLLYGQFSCCKICNNCSFRGSFLLEHVIDIPRDRILVLCGEYRTAGIALWIVHLSEIGLISTRIFSILSFTLTTSDLMISSYLMRYSPLIVTPSSMLAGSLLPEIGLP